jgi:pilus assembly protein CpaF
MSLGSYLCQHGDGGFDIQQQASAYGMSNNDNALRIKLRDALYEQLPSEKIVALLAIDRSRAQREVEAVLEQTAGQREFEQLLKGRQQRLMREVCDMVLGFGPLEDLLADDTVTEIMVNGYQKVFYERSGCIEASYVTFADEQQLRSVIDRILGPLGRRADEQCPMISARLPQGHRVNVVIPPLSLDGAVLTIRKFKEDMLGLDDLRDLGSLDDAVAGLLRQAIALRLNIAVSGGTGSGKTTLLNALSMEIPATERIITIEDAAELRFHTHPHVVRLEARGKNAEGSGEVSIRDLVINALRMRPDRIIVGECRGAEALDMLQAMNTGHDGSLTTLHANSPAEVPMRLVMMARYAMDLPLGVIESQIASALDLIIQVDRQADGTRRLTSISTCHNHGQTAASSISVEELVSWDEQHCCYSWHSRPQWLARCQPLQVEDAVMC